MTSDAAKKVAVYCRLSKEDQEKLQKGDDSESIQNQKLMLMEYAVQQGWQIHKVYSDDDYSGLDKDRPQFNLMIQSAEKRKFDIILCKNQSRFSRDMEQIEKYLHHDFLFWGIRFVGIVDHVDTEQKGGKKSRQINGLVNEWYCEDLSDNIKAALVSKKKNGQYLGYWCTYGYELDPKDHHKIVVDPPAAEVVKEIYSLYLDGYGISAISKILTQKGYPTPSVYKCQKGKKYYNPAKAEFSSKYGVWAVNTIRRILKDKTYLGHLIQGREKKVSYKNKKIVRVPEDEWIVVENNHEPIIDEETFREVQNRIKVKSSCFKNNTLEEIPRPHLFAGKVKCMTCKGSLYKNHGKNNVIYLRCGLAVKTKSQCCTLHTIRLDKLTEIVENKMKEIINRYISSEENKKELLQLYFQQDDLSSKLENKKAVMHTILQKQSELITSLSNLYMDKAKGKITESNFQVLQSNFDRQLRDIDTEMKYVQEEMKKIERELQDRRCNVWSIEKYIHFDTLTHEMVNDFIDGIEIGEKDTDGNQEVKIIWRF